MPFNFTAANSSRITKKSQVNISSLKRSSSSPFAQLNRRKPALERIKSKLETTTDDDGLLQSRLEDAGTLKSLRTDWSGETVPELMENVQARMFDPIPEGGGFNSQTIAQILNYRRSLPPTVSVAHIHGLTESPTATEREISGLSTAGIVKKFFIPNRGTGGSVIGEGLALTKDIEKLVRGSDEIDELLADEFLKDVLGESRPQSINSSLYTDAQITVLMRTGFLTSTSGANNSTDLFSGQGPASAGTVTSISTISRAASGSVAAVGGEGAMQDVGGRGGIGRSSSQYEKMPQYLTDAAKFQLSLPGTGPYLRLLTAARSHLVSLIRKSSFRELPLYLLKERWEGGISADDPAGKAKKYRGEFAGVLPARTRKWKEYYGLSFEWVLAECLGSGLVELMETGTVGRSVRIV
ncbi:MAG: hypothetical protein Q9163_006218 [Psora crenata]